MKPSDAAGHSSSHTLPSTAVRLSFDHPAADSEKLAARAAEASGQPLAAEAFRKRLSRARRTFAGLIGDEVRKTLDAPDDDAVRDELARLGEGGRSLLADGRLPLVQSTLGHAQLAGHFGHSVPGRASSPPLGA